ncbi:NAD(P)-dependent alcohol dehydrogenase [Paludisphaera rhizosphaerae]|uniref:NAD(P)-dependent alcohol dehydrogenase n=1 Tax=Paludisphaera rhizosphaerae TaxID=2711216 RepID=UPI0013ED0954|nr:NAD(P)-dependent alcohol dehydrogenase [Paludisphaera rhizosphaerae]
MKTYQTRAIGTDAPSKPLTERNIPRRDLLPHDVQIEILYCGICHSDLHVVKNDWGGTTYPVVPGHEIVGRVTKVGGEVGKFKVGEVAAIGCIVDSCRSCEYCRSGEEQYCENGWSVVFNSPDKHLGGMSYGGFSKSIVADENYVLRIPELLDPASAAPILCAGITVYSPLKHWKAGPGKKVGVLGMGGLGHMAIKIAAAMGAEVTVFTTSSAKAADAKRLGASKVVVSTDEQQMVGCAKQDLIVDTVSAEHDANAYLKLLKVDGSLVLVGLPVKPLEVGAFNIVGGRKSLSGSNIGGIAETQEVLDFCAHHKIAAEIELLPAGRVNEAMERLEKGDVRYRFVLDMTRL